MSIIELLWILTAFLFVMLVLASAALLWISWDRGQLKGRFKGWAGEQRARWLHLRRLDSKAYKSVHNVLLPHAKRPSDTTQIDHIVVSRFGIFVVETKNWGGQIYGQEHEENWTQTFGRRTKHTKKNPLRQNRGHVEAVVAYCGLDPAQVHSLVFLAGKGQPMTMSDMGDNVVYRYGLAERIESYKTPLIDEATSLLCISLLRDAKRQSTRNRSKAHRETLEQRHRPN